MTCRRYALMAGYVVVGTAAIVLAGTPRVLHGQSPAELRAGYTQLVLVGEGSRTDRLGGEALYDVAVYAEAPPLDPATLASASVPKAIRIEVVSADDPFSPLTRPWRRELVPPINPVAARQLATLTGSVRKGDTLVVDFEPGKGTTIRGNRHTIVSRGSHDLMVAFLDQWLGQRPVSEELKRALLNGLEHRTP